MKWSCSRGFFLATTGWDDTEASSALNLQFPLLWKTLGKAEQRTLLFQSCSCLYRIHSIHYLSALVWTFAHWPWNWIIFALCNICFGSAYYHELAPDDQLLRVSVGNLWAGPWGFKGLQYHIRYLPLKELIKLIRPFFPPFKSLESCYDYPIGVKCTHFKAMKWDQNGPQSFACWL